MSKNISKKFAERVVNSSLLIFTNKYMDRTLNSLGWFFVSRFTFVLLSFLFVSFIFPTHTLYAENTLISNPIIIPTIITPTSTPTSIISPAKINTTRVIKLTTPRMKGDDVKALQTFLNNIGYNTGTPDGIFGPKTQAQVKLFQKANKLTPDGIIGPKTRIFVNNNNTSTSPIVSVPQASQFAGCTSSTLYSTTTGFSCSTGLTVTIFSKPISGGSSSPRIRTISNSTISGVTIPAQAEIPTVTLSDNNQYTATISWVGTPSVFLASTSYTAVITITPKDGYTLTGVPANFFTVAGATTTNDINSGVATAIFPATPLKQLTISTPTIATSKSYDGDTEAVVTVGTLSGIIGTEDVTVTALANYDTKDVGTNKTITVVYTLDGGDKDNYIKPADYTVATGVITQIPLTISNPTLTTSKQYDRTTTAVVTAGTLSGVVSGDDVIPTAIANYDTPSVNTGKTITISYSLSGLDSINYIKPIDRIEYTGVITQKQLTIGTPVITSTKLYDRNTSASVTIGTLSGVIGTEDVSVSGIANYEDANASTDKDITVVYTISGASIANYVKPVNYTIDTGVINPIQLTISNPTLTTTKEYNANTSAIVTAGTLSGILSPDAVTVTALADYDNSSVGTDKTITTVHTLAGAQAGNYTKPIDYIVTNGIITPIVINTPLIAGVTAPQTDGTSVTTVTETNDYTGTVSWSGSPTTFLNATIYTATITLTPKTGRTLTGITENFFTVAGATSVTNPINSGIITAIFPETQAYASTPSSITLVVGSTAPVGGVTNVSIPNPGATDTTGMITGWQTTTADKIKFTVVDSGSAVSTITINGSPYTSGTDYQVIATSSFPTVIVTTTEANRTTTIRTFVITGPITAPDGLSYGVVLGADSKVWLDRNLGATRVATALNDTQSYGHYYQWGRATDGHQIGTSGTTSTLSSSDTPGDANFIMSPSSPYDWRSPQNNNLWQGVNGVNNVCPAGFRLPTSADWSTLTNAIGGFTTATCGGSSTCNTVAFNSSLKIPVAGYRVSSNASLSSQGSSGFYWSSSPSGTVASLLYFVAPVVVPAYANYRAFGFSVRCLKN